MKLTYDEIINYLEYCSLGTQAIREAAELIKSQRAEIAVLNKKLTDAYLMIAKLRGDADD